MISIITPVYKAKEYIDDTIQAVRSQTYQDWEWLMVEDCSPDGTGEYLEKQLEILKDDRIRLIRLEKNGGAARARNKALEYAQGRYIAYIDADDLWLPDKLEKELAFMQEKQAGFVFTGYEFADEKGVPTGKIVRVPETITYKQALKNTTIFTTTVLFDTEKIPKDQLDMPIVKSEDTALWWKILKKYKVAYGLDENLALYRRPAASLSSNKVEAVKRIWNLYRKQERLNIFYSAWNFCFWAFRAVARRV